MGKGLSKSKYVAFCTCSKALWLKTYKPDEEAIDEGVKDRFETGNQVGDLAMKYFGKFVEVTTTDDSGNLDLTAMIKKTKDEIAKGTKVICEASFTYGGNYCAVDILKKNKSGYDIYEVKSSTSDDKEVYFEDVAYQKWLLEKCGLVINDVYLMHINNQYVMEDTLDVKQLFIAEKLNDDIKPYYDEVKNDVANAKRILESKKEPSCLLGEQCFSPYQCGFFSYCTKGIKKPNVFDLYGMHKSVAAKYYNQGITTFKQLKKEEITDAQKKQIDCTLNNKEIIDKVGIKKFLKTISYPLYFLDFETFSSAVPIYKGTRPYQQITFQYSLHILKRKGGKLIHKEFLGDPKSNPMKDLAKQLCVDIPEDVCVLAYNMRFEKGRIEEMAKMFPKLKKHLLNISNNIVDLITPFRAWQYYNKDMGGSFSIKYVLPALFPNDPSLNYQNLSGSVHNGGEASSIFPKMKDMNKKERDEARDSLLEYCGLDTYAMVKVLEKLYEVSN